MSLFTRLHSGFQRLKRYLQQDVWHIGAVQGEQSQGILVKHVRVAFLVLKSVVQEQLTVRAAALTFTTTLAIVPFLAFMFYLISAFNISEDLYDLARAKIEAGIRETVELLPGRHPRPEADEEGSAVPAVNTDGAGDEAEPSEALEAGPPVEQADTAPGAVDEAAPTPAPEEEIAEGEQAPGDDLDDTLFRELLETVLSPAAQATNGGERTDPVDFLIDMARRASDSNVLGVAGLVFVLTTVFGLMRNIEESFNGIWGVAQTRSWYTRFSSYLFITLLLPFVAAILLGVIGALQSETVLAQLGRLAPLVHVVQVGVLWLLFTLFYIFVPSTKVRVNYALVGGLVATLLWSLASWAYIKFQFGLARYDLFFLALAQFPLLLMWIYTSWVIVLLGAVVTFAYQNEQTFALEQLAKDASFSYREGVGLRVMIEMARRFEAGEPPLLAAEAAAEWNVPVRLVNDTLEVLREAGLVSQCATDPPRFQPARSPSRITLRDVVHALRGAGNIPSDFLKASRVGALLEAVYPNDEGLAGKTIADAAAAWPDRENEEREGEPEVLTFDEQGLRRRME